MHSAETLMTLASPKYRESSMQTSLRMVVAFAILLLLMAVQAANAAARLHPLLTHMRQVSELTAEQARQEYPVVIRGVVTYADMSLGHAFVQDSTGATFVYFDPRSNQPLLRAGQLVEVHAVSAAGDFSSCLKDGRFTVIGTAALPRPKRLPVDQLISGRWVCYWAEVEGTIRSGNLAAGSLEIDLSTENGKILVIMQDYPDWERTLVGAKVRMRGPLSALYNQHRQARGVKIFVPGPQYVTVLNPPPADPYALPATPPSAIGQYDVTSDLEAQIRVRGTVTAIEPGPLVYVSDIDSTVAVESYPSCSPQPGKLVDIVGFRALVNGRPGVVDAACRVVDVGETLTPSEVTAQDVLTSEAEPSGDPTVFLHNSTRYDLRLVRIEAALLQASRGPQGLTLVLGSRNREFTATLPRVAGAPPAEPEVGSTVRLTGLCVVTYDSYSRPLAFRLVLRHPADIVLLSNPPWWTLPRLWAMLAIATTVALAWIALLRRRVRAQMAALGEANAKAKAIQKLTQAMQEVTVRKDFSAQVPVEGYNEIAQLSVEFNNMLAELHQSDLARGEAESRLLHQALTDELTGLPNRRLLTDRLSQTLAAAERSDQIMALLYIDLDGFKLVNDSLGHSVGDTLLGRVAERFRLRIRKADTLARIGGDEFIIVLAMMHSKEEAEMVAKSLLEALAPPFLIDNHEITIGASVGIGLFPENSADADELLQQADSAMYAAKRGGKNRVMYFSPQLATTARERLNLENQLRGALSRGEIHVHYQAQFDISSERLVRFEALARWTHPTLGVIPPSKFIPIAEDSGLIISIGAYILEQACTEAVKWQTISPEPMQVAVNVSSIQFIRNTFVEEVDEVLCRTGLKPSLLQLELTESVMLNGMERAAETMRRLQALGISIAIDDFGTGYSCFSYLPRLPFNVLKIDRSFVKELDLKPEMKSMVQCLITLAHKLNMQVVVEGIETPHQLEMVKDFGGNQAQGFFLGRPTSDPTSQLAAKIKHSQAASAGLGR